MAKPLHLLISRTDAIGDLCLTLPSIGWLKSLQPEWRITLLVKAYAAPVAQACHWVDQVAVLPEEMNATQLSGWLRGLQADHIVHVFPNRRIATAAAQAGIKQRSGVWGRVYHWFNCNNRVWMSRARSNHHEAYLNLLLLSKLLHLPTPSDAELRQHVVDWSGMRPGRSTVKNNHIVLHPFSRGNGREWPVEYFAALAQLMIDDGWQPVIGGTAQDAQAFAAHQALFPAGCLNVMGEDSLAQYIQRIADAAGLVASGTGPLHIASLLGQNGVGLFPPKHGVSQTRWGAIGPANTNLQLPGPCDTVCSNHECACMRAISPAQVWLALQQHLTATLTTDATQ